MLVARSVQIQASELAPLGQQQQRVGALGDRVGVAAQLDLGQEARGWLDRDRVEGRTCAPFGSRSRWMISKAGDSRRSSVLGLKARPSTPMTSILEAAQLGAQLLQHRGAHRG